MRWRRHVWPAAFTALLLSVLVGLGVWQLERLRWKRDLIAAMEVRIGAAPVPLASLSGRDDAEYRQVIAHGVFAHDHSFFLFALAAGSGAGGYHLLTPLRLEDGDHILVDRGWLPYDRRAGPEADVFRPKGAVRIVGILRRPARHWSQPADDPARNDWYGVDLEHMAVIAGVAHFLPYVIEVDATPNPGGFPVGGQTRLVLPNDHLGYALTWFGLAVAVAVIFALWLVRGSAADYTAAGSAPSWPRPDAPRR